MITLNSLSKIYRTVEIETVALENVNLTRRTRRICRYNGTFRMRKIHPAEHNGIA